MSTAKVHEINDAFRITMTGGRVVMTAGVDALAGDVKAMVIRTVATFTEFTPDNYPHGEHDFGSFNVAGQKFVWKIDHYDAAMEIRLGGSGRPGKNHARTHDHARERVLMVAYFIRRRGKLCSVINLHLDNREEVVQDGLSLVEAEVLCAAKMADIPKPRMARQPELPGPCRNRLSYLGRHMTPQSSRPITRH